MADASAMKTVAELLGDNPPSNWGKWGPNDEVGSLNYLTPAQVMRGVSSVRSGEVFTLQVPIGSQHSECDPVWPTRTSAVRTSVMDEGFWARGEVEETPDGHHYADDKIDMFLQGSTQYDALGHLWYNGKIWNGYSADTTIDRLDKASVCAIGEHGVVGRGVLIDMARFRGKQFLEPAETFTHLDLIEAARTQGATIEKSDILVVRTGWMKRFYSLSSEEFYADFHEPGLTYSRELVEWFQEMEIPNLVTDLIGNETSIHPGTDIEVPLHSALMRNLGVVFTEICWLDDLAEACAKDGRWTFLYTAAPLKVVGASGAPVNPIAIR